MTREEKVTKLKSLVAEVNTLAKTLMEEDCANLFFMMSSEKKEVQVQAQTRFEMEVKITVNQEL